LIGLILSLSELKWSDFELIEDSIIWGRMLYEGPPAIPDSMGCAWLGVRLTVAAARRDSAVAVK
jgi:hypothetical protein